MPKSKIDSSYHVDESTCVVSLFREKDKAIVLVEGVDEINTESTWIDVVQFTLDNQSIDRIYPKDINFKKAFINHLKLVDGECCSWKCPSKLVYELYANINYKVPHMVEELDEINFQSKKADNQVISAKSFLAVLGIAIPSLLQYEVEPHQKKKRINFSFFSFSDSADSADSGRYIEPVLNDTNNQFINSNKTHINNLKILGDKLSENSVSNEDKDEVTNLASKLDELSINNNKI